MQIAYCFVVGALFSIAVYLLLHPSMMRMLFGFMILSSTINLLLFVMGRISYGKPVFLSPQNDAVSNIFANPLPQALILTAIVIGFGLLAYFLVLVRCLWQHKRTLNISHERTEV